MDVTHNAGAVADDLEAGAKALAELEATNTEAGRLALEKIDPETPRRSGNLAAGGRIVADPLGFAYVNAVPYAVIVDTQTGFATETLRRQEEAIAGVYENHVEASLTALT